METYEQKYIKYKEKYINLKILIGRGNNNQHTDEVEITINNMAGEPYKIMIPRNEKIYEFRKRFANIRKIPVYNIKLLRDKEVLEGTDPIYIEGSDNITFVRTHTTLNFTLSTGKYLTAILTDGDVVVRGKSGQIRDVPILEENETFTMVSVGYYHVSAITSNGRAVCWGGNQFGQVSEIPELELNETFTMISAWGDDTVAITSEGRVVCWGKNSRDEILKIPTLRPGEFYTMISAGDTHRAALTSFGRVVSWGSNYDYSQEADMLKLETNESDETVTMISVGFHYIVALTSKGRAICWGYMSCKWSKTKKIFDIPELESGEFFTIISAGKCYVSAITSYGRVVYWCWQGHSIAIDASSRIKKLEPDEYYTMIDTVLYDTIAKTSYGRVVSW